MKAILQSFAVLIGSMLVISSCTKDQPTQNTPFIGTIKGKITDGETGNGILGVNVSTIPATQVVTSDASGNYSIPDVGAGTYQVIAFKTGYNVGKATIQLSNKTATSDIVLAKGSANNSTSDLVAHYPFTSDASDATGNGHTGVVMGAVLTADRFGTANSAYHFNGNNQYITVNNATDLNFGSSQSFTVNTWIKSSGSQPDFAGIIAKQNDQSPSARRPGFQMNIRNSNYSGVIFETNEDFTQPPIGSNLGTGWHFISLVMNRDINQILPYIDGVAQNTISIPHGSVDNSFPLLIGTDRTYSQFFNGDIDDIQIYKKALTSTEIATLYHENGW